MGGVGAVSGTGAPAGTQRKYGLSAGYKKGAQNAPVSFVGAAASVTKTVASAAPEVVAARTPASTAGTGSGARRQKKYGLSEGYKKGSAPAGTQKKYGLSAGYKHNDQNAPV